MDKVDRGEPSTEALKSPEAGDSSFSATDAFSGDPSSGGRRTLAFATGALVSGRYRILRFIASGGMGEVYEADDLELDVRVALKTLRLEITSDARALERFKLEIALARKVTHPNVCRIFDLGWHRDGDGPAVTFLTMEILPGETLAEHLRREKAMAPGQALPLLRQMAGALAAAHRAGVIHRDFKSANVMLVPTHDGFRAVVTDFGLARTGVSSAQTESGEIVGTPAYVAPEQLQGGRVGAPADVYAFGVVMFEVLLGRRPFSGDSSMDAALFRLNLGDTSVERRGTGLDPRYGPIAIRCLEREPSSRYADGSALLAAIERAAGSSKRRRALWLAGAAALAVLSASVAIPYLLSRRESGAVTIQGSPASRLPRRAVAVLGFKNVSGKPQAAWLSTALSEMLTTELAAGERLRTLPGEAVSRMKIELGVPDADSLAPDTLAKIRANLGADLVVMGSYVALGDPSGSVRLDVRLQDAAAGETLAALSETGTEDRLFDLVSSAGSALRAKLGVGSATATEAAAAQAGLPSNAEEARLYARGLESLRRFEFMQAKDEMQTLVMLSPKSPLAHAALSDAWSKMGYMDNAKAEARKAFELSEGLPRAERLSIEGHYRETNAEWGKAAEIYRSLLTFYPDNLDYGLRLASAQRTAGDAKAAVLTLGELRKLPGSVGEDPRIDLEEAKTDEAIADYPGALTASQRAVARARQAGARLVVAQGLVVEGSAFRKLGETANASASLDEALSIYGTLGDVGGEAQTLQALFTQKLAASDGSGLVETLERSITVYRKLGDKARLAAALQNLSQFLLYGWTDLKRATTLSEESVALCRELGEPRELCLALYRMGNVLYYKGNLKAAREDYEESLDLARGCGEVMLMHMAVWKLASVALARGDLSATESRLQDAIDGLHKISATDARILESEARLVLAQLKRDQGRPAEAERECREVLAVLSPQREMEDQEKLTLVCLARTLLDQGKVSEARRTLDRAAGIPHRWPAALEALDASLCEAEVLRAEGKAGQAEKAAERVLAEAKACGVLPVRFDALLLIGKIELETGRAPQGQARLASLEREATAKGWLLVASHARESARQK